MTRITYTSTNFLKCCSDLMRYSCALTNTDIFSRVSENTISAALMQIQSELASQSEYTVLTFSCEERGVMII